MWTYFAGFRPQAYGTEKFMDYGFMEALMRMYDSSGEGSVVFGRYDQLLLWWSVFCGVSDEIVRK